jgi:PKD repeat protein/endonuclease/exonuclease/phosphatase family metal-dependent hydrolase
MSSLRAILTILLIVPAFVTGDDVDTLSVATYNILNFPGPSGPTRVPYLRMSLEMLDPDVLVVQEMLSQSGTNTFLSDVLNHEGSEYSAAPFYNGPDTDNMLFYKHAKVDYISTEQIPTRGDSGRDISAYTLSLDDKPDFEFIIYSLHLKASQGSENEYLRYLEVLDLKDHADDLPPGTHYLVAGDFNIYKSTEDAYETLMDDFANDLDDPIDRPGVWHNSMSFADIHNQSTRVEDLGDGGATGGMDDRFNQILTSEPFDSLDGLMYIDGSYFAFGNDGNHFNLSINDGTNTSVPDSIADALYYGSDHLPVYAEFEFTTGYSVPVADFAAQPTSGESPLLVQFSDSSAGTITSWKWDFGDGDSSALADPTHTYGDSGQFDVTLIVSGPGGSDTLTKSGYITVTLPAPNPDSAWLSLDPSGLPVLRDLEMFGEDTALIGMILLNGSDTAHSVMYPLTYDTSCLSLMSLEFDTTTFPLPAVWTFYDRDTIIGDSGKVFLYAFTMVSQFGIPPAVNRIGTMELGAVPPETDSSVCVLDTCFYPPQGHLYYSYAGTADDYWPEWTPSGVTVFPFPGLCGDANGDEYVTTGDAYLILNYFGSGTQPVSCWAANVNGDDILTTGDGFTLLNYFGSGPSLDCRPCEF